MTMTNNKKITHGDSGRPYKINEKRTRNWRCWGSVSRWPGDRCGLQRLIGVDGIGRGGGTEDDNDSDLLWVIRRYDWLGSMEVVWVLPFAMTMIPGRAPRHQDMLIVTYVYPGGVISKGNCCHCIWRMEAKLGIFKKTKDHFISVFPYNLEAEKNWAPDCYPMWYQNWAATPGTGRADGWHPHGWLVMQSSQVASTNKCFTAHWSCIEADPASRDNKRITRQE